MVLLLIITSALLLFYLSYPLFLMTLRVYKPAVIKENYPVRPVSLILLTYNGREHIREKMDFLQRELEKAGESELIVIDDCSHDGTRELLESLKITCQFNLVLKKHHQGIPHSMNLAAEIARFDILVFCDQRQEFSDNFLSEITIPFEDADVGAVSGIICCRDNGNQLSFLRKHENFIKQCESRLGMLIGVYGPLHAVRKSCYREIPENVILDDLWLSLAILQRKRIVMSGNCRIVDDDFNGLYNLQRSKRYLQGLVQILVRRGRAGNLPMIVWAMLLWHKYLRLLIPPMMVACYLASSILFTRDEVAAAVCILFTCGFLISIAGIKTVVFSNISSMFRITAYYVVSLLLISIQRVFRKDILPKQQSE